MTPQTHTCPDSLRRMLNDEPPADLHIPQHQFDPWPAFYRAGRMFFWTCVALAGAGLVFIAGQILLAFYSGAVHQALSDALKGGQ